MWAIRNETAYATERTWVRDKHGRHHWIVVAKATFEFDANGRLSLADEQLPPLHEPEYFGEAGASSLRYEADLVAHKPGTDVLVNAHAHAPGRRASKEVAVALRIRQLEKRLLVRGEATYILGTGSLGTSTPTPFVSRPIRYELAYGGSDTLDDDPRKHRIDLRNPVGTGFAARHEHLIGGLAPSIYYPRGIASRVGPAGFGPLASYWSPRLELGGTYDQHWIDNKKPLLPDNYDEAQLLCAPQDQRLASYVQGGELVELINLTPMGALRLQLPTIDILCTTRISGRTSEHRCDLVSVIIEPEDHRLIMVWQGSITVGASEVDYLDETRVREASASRTGS